jgi:hypothetical protein
MLGFVESPGITVVGLVSRDLHFEFSPIRSTSDNLVAHRVDHGRVGIVDWIDAKSMRCTDAAFYSEPVGSGD